MGVIAAYLFDRALNDEAIRDAKNVTTLAGQGIVEPALTDELLAGDQRAQRKLGRIVEERVLGHDGIVRVKIWDRHGRIVYSDEPRLIGETYALGPDEKAILENGGTDLEGTDPSSPASGLGFWYLVRAVSATGLSGSYTSGGARERPGRDAEIEASGEECP